MRQAARPTQHRIDRPCPRFDRLESRRLCAFVAEFGFETTGDTTGWAIFGQSSGVASQPPTILGGFAIPTIPGGQVNFGEGGFVDPLLLPRAPITPLGVVGTDPAPGTVLGNSIRSLTVTFDRTIDPTSLTSNADLQLVRVDEVGGGRRIDDASVAPGMRADQLVLTPAQGLAPGLYRIELWGISGLRGVDGSLLGGDGTNQPLGDFRIEVEGVGLGDAIDLGTPGPIPTSTRGDLDFRADPSQVRLYKITLPDGHFWRLGLEVTAERDGGMLDSALALFDAQGRPISSAEGGRDGGRRDAPKDPYLFAGLEPGTYYIGVSGTRNRPGLPDGYDPATSDAGSVSQAQAGGPFTLHVVADPADQPISLVGFDLDRADPLASTVTGLTLGFSGAIRPDTQTTDLDDALSGSIEVVDRVGRVWPVAALAHDESAARVSFLFRDQLPEGHYTVRLPRRGGLVDLAGHVPVAIGQPAGVLGGFAVGPGDATPKLRDLGPLLPNAAIAGVSAAILLAPGDSASYRFVVTFAGMYTFQSRHGGGPLAIALDGPEGVLPIDAGDPDVVNGTNDTFLEPGAYEIRVTAAGTLPVRGFLTIKSPSTGPESIALNGVGQGPGLSLRLVAPPVVNPPPPAPGFDPILPTPPPPPPPPPSAPAPMRPALETGDATASPGPLSAGATDGLASLLVAVAPGQTTQGLFLGLGGDLLGRPTSEVSDASSVGPGGEARLVALAYGDGGLRQGSGQRSGPTRRSPSDGPGAEIVAPAGRDDVAGFGREVSAPGVLPQLEARWLIRPISAIVPASEAGLEVVPRDGHDDAAPSMSIEVPRDESLVDPSMTAQARVYSAADTTLAVVVIGHSFHRVHRWLGRLPAKSDRKSRRLFPGGSPFSGG